MHRAVELALQHRLIDFPQQPLRPFILHPDDDSVGMEKILDPGAFPQKFRIRGDPEARSGAAAVDGQRPLQFLPGAHGNSALFHDQLRRARLGRDQPRHPVAPPRPPRRLSSAGPPSGCAEKFPRGTVRKWGSGRREASPPSPGRCRNTRPSGPLPPGSSRLPARRIRSQALKFAQVCSPRSVKQYDHLRPSPPCRKAGNGAAVSAEVPPATLPGHSEFPLAGKPRLESSPRNPIHSSRGCVRQSRQRIRPASSRWKRASERWVAGLSNSSRRE
jgi:hypothetical protein